MTKPTAKDLIRLWPFLVLGLLAVVFVLMLIFSRKAPVIASLEPDMAAPGQQVVILGDYFGRTEREGSLSLAGEIPPPSLIQSWSDQKIVFVVPEDASSGLVTVSNSQGTSTGVLFTNTETIPTVLQPAGPQGMPLLVSVVPSQPQGGQLVTLTGRGWGAGEARSFVRVSTGPRGPVLELTPADCAQWADRSVSFRWPTGAGTGSTVQVVTPRGETPALALEASSPLVFEDPRSLLLEVQISLAVPSGTGTVLWGPVPQALSGTAWTLMSAQPAPVPGFRPLVFRWPAGSSGDRRATYTLQLTSWARRWEGFPAGTVSAGEAPKGDARPLDWWKPAQAAVKALTVKWGLETPDPWLRVQRIQTGLAASFQFETVSEVPTGLVRPPAQVLGARTLNALEASSLAVVLAAQAGVPGRLVTGLVDDGQTLAPRVWTEVWFAGAGWVPWDPLVGPAGSLDNGHFLFETVPSRPVRLESRARLLAASSAFGQGEPPGEAVWTDQEPVVQWEFKRTKK